MTYLFALNAGICAFGAGVMFGRGRLGFATLWAVYAVAFVYLAMATARVNHRNARKLN